MADVPLMNNPMTTQDDIIVGGASGAPGRLAKGSDSQVLTVDPTTHHLVWATPAAAGAVATDAIWDAKGDLAAGTGANTAAKLPAGADGKFLMTDSSQSTGLKWVGQTYAIVRYTTGDITLGSGTSPVAVSGPGDLVVAAVSGDLLMVGLSARCTDTDADSLSFDFATIVSAAAVNFISSLNGTPATTGVPGWYLGSSRVEACHGEHPYVVQSGDLSGGNITLRLYYRVSGTGKVLGASSGIPLEFWVRNLHQ